MSFLLTISTVTPIVFESNNLEIVDLTQSPLGNFLCAKKLEYNNYQCPSYTYGILSRGDSHDLIDKSPKQFRKSADFISFIEQTLHVESSIFVTLSFQHNLFSNAEVNIEDAAGLLLEAFKSSFPDIREDVLYEVYNDEIH